MISVEENVQIKSLRHLAQREQAGLRIRSLEKRDLPALEWEGTYSHFRRLYEKAYLRSLHGEAMLWVSDLPEQSVVGQIFVLLVSAGNRKIADGKRRAFIHSFRVRPEFRNGGLGSLMLKHAEQDLINRQFRMVSLNVARDNLEAIRFYERAAYLRIAKEAGRWSYIDHLGLERHVHEPSWRMQKIFELPN